MNRAECRSCKKAVYWVVTENGKKMPIDCMPVADGNIVIRKGIAVYLHKGEETELSRYVSHFATCPHAPSHRKGKA